MWTSPANWIIRLIIPKEKKQSCLGVRFGPTWKTVSLYSTLNWRCRTFNLTNFQNYPLAIHVGFSPSTKNNMLYVKIKFVQCYTCNYSQISSLLKYVSLVSIIIYNFNFFELFLNSIIFNYLFIDFILACFARIQIS